MLSLSLMMAGLFIIASCSDDDVKDFAQVTIQAGEDPLELPRTSGEYAVDIAVDGAWYIDIEGKFVYVSQEDSCGTGSKTITLYTTTNRHDKDRDATLHVVSSQDKNKRESILLRQLGLDNDPENADDTQTGNQIYAVGYGYDTSDCWASPRSVRAEILKTSDCLKKGIITTGSVELTYNADISTGSSVTELSNDLSVSAKVSGGGFGFKGEAGASFKMKDFSSNNYEYSIACVSVALKTAETKKTTVTLRKNCMTPEAYQEINGLDADGNQDENACDYPSTNEGFRELLEAYGTHMVMNAKLGGQVKYAMRVDVSQVKGSYDLNAYANMSYSGIVNVSASVSDDLKKSYENNKKNCKITLNVLGGGTKEALDLAEGDVSKNIEAWRQSLIKGQNLALVDFSDNALVPLYELVDKTKFPRRYEALKAFMATERDRQIKGVKMEYQCGTATKLDELPNMSDDRYGNGKLIQDVYAGGQWVGRICSEYIPLIDDEKRVQVIYPVFSGKVKYNMGYFIGDNYHRPAKICWQGNNVKITEDKIMPIGQLKGPFYFRGTSCSSKSYDDEVNGKVQYGQVVTAHGSYNIVKIFNKIWLRSDYNGEVAEDGYGFGNNRNLKPKRLSSGPYRYTLDMVFATAYHFGFSGWRVPYASDYLNIVETLRNNGVKMTPYRAFCMGKDYGVLGFDYRREADGVFIGDEYYGDGWHIVASPNGGPDGVINFVASTEAVIHQRKSAASLKDWYMSVRLVQDIE